MVTFSYIRERERGIETFISNIKNGVEFALDMTKLLQKQTQNRSLWLNVAFFVMFIGLINMPKTTTFKYKTDTPYTVLNNNEKH